MEATLSRINEVVSEAGGQLEALWTEIGFNEDTCQHRRLKMVELIRNLMTDMIEGERSLKKTLVESIEECGPKFYHLNKELDAKLPDPEDELSVMELERYLRRAVTKMEHEVKARRKDLEELRAKELELCEYLKEEPSILEKKAIPSKESIEDLNRIVKTLQQERDDRRKNLLRLKARLEALLEELELSPTSSFECSVVQGFEDFLFLSRENLQRLKVLNEEYEKQVEDNKTESMELQEKIRHLSDRLGHDPGERDQLLASIAGHTPSALAKLREELDRLEEAKRENIGHFILQLRQELDEMWTKCYIHEEEKESFAPYASDDLTEEVLEGISAELERLRKHHEENKQLYSTLDQWFKLWFRHIALEERSNNPDRLFGNRGCALLQEERERRRVKNELPNVEKKAEELAKVYEEVHGQPILVLGRLVSDLFLENWHRYYDRKEQEKKERQSVRTKNLLHETRMGSRPRTGSMKRQLGGDSTINKWAKQRRVQENASPEPSATSTMCSTPQHLAGRGILREQNQRTLRSNAVEKDRSTGSSQVSSQASQDISTYSAFSNTLHLRSRQENIRSSTIYGLSRTPGPNGSKRTSPRRAPQGLPKTPRTLPRTGPRRSPRLNASKTQSRAKRNISTASPMGLSAAFKSPLRTTLRSNTTTTHTPTRWSKVSFLI